MMRDRVTVNVPSSVDPVMIHTGGKVDVYCRAGLEYSLEQLRADSDGKVMIPGPAINIERSTVTGGSDDDTIPVYQTATASTLTSAGVIATMVTASPHGFTSGDSVTILGATPTGYNVTATITVTNPTTFTYPVVSGLTTPATGTIMAHKDTPFTKRRNGEVLASIGAGNMTSSGTTITVVSTNHPFMANRYITISGASQSQYNGSYIVTAVTKDTFTYTASSAPSVSPATGTIQAVQIASDRDIAYSDRNTVADSILYADFGVTQANKTASFNILRHKLISDVQGYLDDSANRVVCGDYMARGFNVYLLAMNITGYNGPSPDASTCQTLVNKYISSLEPGENFVMSDLVSTLHTGGITNIKTPITITYTLYTKDMIFPPLTGTITDYLDPADRTTIFYLDVLTTDNTSI